MLARTGHQSSRSTSAGARSFAGHSSADCTPSSMHVLRPAAAHLLGRPLQGVMMQASASYSVQAGTYSVAVVGGGVAGAVAAVHLAKMGCKVHVFDMGRVAPGGRVSSRLPIYRSPSLVQYDHGAQFIGAPRSARFKELLEEWRLAGLVEPWEGTAGTLDAVTGTFTPSSSTHSAGGPSTSVFGLPDLGGAAYVGVPSMGSLVGGLLDTQPAGVEVQLGTRVSKVQVVSTPTSSSSDQRLGWLVHGSWGPRAPDDLGTFQAVVIADSMAARQGSPGHIVLQPVELSPDQATSDNTTAANHLVAGAQQALDSLGDLKRVPLFSLMAAWEQGLGGPGSGPGSGVGESKALLGFSRACVTSSPTLSWLSVDSTKPGRSPFPTLVALTTPEYAQELLGTTQQGAPLPPQTSEYLTQRAQRMWADIQPELTRARGGVPLPEPTQLSIHRWGSAASQPPLGKPCVAVTESPPPSGQAAKTGNAVAPRACFVLAGDFCLGPGIENAALSGLAAAEAVLAAAGKLETSCL